MVKPIRAYQATKWITMIERVLYCMYICVYKLYISVCSYARRMHIWKFQKTSKIVNDTRQYIVLDAAICMLVVNTCVQQTKHTIHILYKIVLWFFSSSCRNERRLQFSMCKTIGFHMGALQLLTLTRFSHHHPFPPQPKNIRRSKSISFLCGSVCLCVCIRNDNNEFKERMCLFFLFSKQIGWERIMVCNSLHWHEFGIKIHPKE